MAKIIFEGTEEQLKNLKLLVDSGDNDLPRVRDDYQKDNLWSIEDVQSVFECTDDEAMDVLEAALRNAATRNQIWFAIGCHGEENGLQLKV